MSQYRRPGANQVPIAVNDVVLITTPEGTTHPSGCGCGSCSGDGGAVTGAQGTQGVTGAQGVQGTTGAGTQGIQGPMGPGGGAQGTQGTQGVQGTAGTTYTPVAISNTYYVAKNGNDSNNGQNQDTPFLTIKHAMSVATSGTAVRVASGTYTEQNPVTIPAGVSLVGDSLRTVKISGATTNADIFYVNNSTYITEVTFINHVAPAAAVAFNPDGSAGVISSSPYVYNCSSVTTTGTGMRIDGSKATGGKSMVSGQYTQVNRGGKGIHILNQGYAQLVGIYTIFTDIGILCESGGFCSLIGSDTSFGNYGLKASGVSSLLYSGTAPDIATTATTATITGLSHTPYINNVVTFDDGANYYTVSGVTPISAGSSTITLTEPLKTTVSSGATAKFYQPSRITASGHTFEYCGTGIDPATALPQLGGIPIEAHEVVEENGGRVYYTSTDQKGNFKIGGDLTIDRGLGTITGITFDKSLFAVMTPYILALEG
jgi:hypothetical protein